MRENNKNFLNFANNLADIARTISLKYYKKKLKIINKKKVGYDPVTIADLEIQKKINKKILSTFPNHSIFGEEESFKKESDFEWCIDPIDGTKSFIQGVPLWGTLISLSKKEKIIIGIVDIPALDERYIGYKKNAYKVIKDQKFILKARNTRNLSEAILNTTSPYVFKNKNDQKSFEKLRKFVKTTRLGGDCYSYCLLADGFVDIVVESGLKPWDIRAIEPIIKNSGGKIVTWENKPIFNGGRIIASSNKKILDRSMKILKKTQL